MKGAREEGSVDGTAGSPAGPSDPSGGRSGTSSATSSICTNSSSGCAPLRHLWQAHLVESTSKVIATRPADARNSPIARPLHPERTPPALGGGWTSMRLERPMCWLLHVSPTCCSHETTCSPMCVPFHASLAILPTSGKLKRLLMMTTELSRAGVWVVVMVELLFDVVEVLAVVVVMEVALS